MQWRLLYRPHQPRSGSRLKTDHASCLYNRLTSPRSVTYYFIVLRVVSTISRQVYSRKNRNYLIALPSLFHERKVTRPSAFSMDMRLCLYRRPRQPTTCCCLPDVACGIGACHDVNLTSSSGVSCAAKLQRSSRRLFSMLRTSRVASFGSRHVAIFQSPRSV